MSVVLEKDAVDCPGLIGPANMAKWHVVFKFHDRQMVTMGLTRPMVLTATRHPGLNLCEYGKLDVFQTDASLQELYEQLRTCPYTFTFMQGGPDDSEHDSEDEQDFEDTYESI